MVKIVHEKVNELHDEFDKIEAKKKGKWIDLYYTVENDKVAVKVTGLKAVCRAWQAQYSTG